MNNIFKYIIFFFIIILYTGCSFDDKTGIWSGEEKERERIAELEKEQSQKQKTIKIYSSKEIVLEEILPSKTIQLSQAVKNTSWQMPGLNLKNNIGNIYLSGFKNNFLKKKIGKNKFPILKVRSSPLVYNNYIILCDDRGTIYKINKRGKKIWTKNIYKKIYKKIYKNLSLSIDDNKIYVADNIGFIYVINFDTGKLVWIKNHGIPLKSNIKIFDKKIYLVNQDNRLLSLSQKDGSIIWDVRSSTSFIKTQNLLSLAIAPDGTLITLNSSGDLLKIKASSGQIYWSLKISAFNFIQDNDFFSSSKIVIDENAIIFSSQSSIFSINLSNGNLNWKLDMNLKNTPIIDKKNVYLVSDSGYFVNVDKITGKVVWSINILKVLKRRKQKTQVTGFIIGSGKIYMTTLNGYLIVYSAVSGKNEYIKKIGDAINADPIISNGELYVLTDKSRIFGFN